MPFRTPVCDLFGIERPIFGFAHSVAVTAAISRAGGLGVYGATMDEPEEIAEKARQLRALCGDRPFGIDPLPPSAVGDETDRAKVQADLPQGHKDFVAGLAEKYAVPPPTAKGFYGRNVRSQTLFRRQVEAALASEADVFAAAVGVPPAVIAEAKAAGKRTISLVGAVRHAEKAVAAGVDLIVAQGHDAGAHTGPIGTFSLVPQVVDAAGGVPVLAAGGVGHGRHVAAALALGAQGVWLGTAWLTSAEHALEPITLAKPLAAGSEDTVISRSYSGKTLRMIRTAWSEEWSAPGAPEPLPMPFQQVLIGDFLTAVREHRVAPLMWEAAGQSVAWFREVRTVAEIMGRLCDEADAALAALPRPSAA